MLGMRSGGLHGQGDLVGGAQSSLLYLEGAASLVQLDSKLLLEAAEQRLVHGEHHSCQVSEGWFSTGLDCSQI